MRQCLGAACIQLSICTCIHNCVCVCCICFAYTILTRLVLRLCDVSFGSSVAEFVLLLLGNQVGIAFQGMKCVYPPGRKLGAIEVTEWGLACLDDGQMLRDDIVGVFAM